MLAASRELHKYFHDCKDTLQRVNERARGVGEELGRDAVSVGTLQRKHHNFMQDLSTLQQQVGVSQSFNQSFIGRWLQYYLDNQSFNQSVNQSMRYGISIEMWEKRRDKAKCLIDY